jgi:hypothetical protein
VLTAYAACHYRDEHELFRVALNVGRSLPALATIAPNSSGETNTNLSATSAARRARKAA